MNGINCIYVSGRDKFGNRKWGLVNKEGKVLLPCTYNNWIEAYETFNRKLKRYNEMLNG